MEDVEEELQLLSELANIEIGRREKRPLCSRCCRPQGVCWCRGVYRGKLSVLSRVVVLQHPHEERRCLRTAPILKAFLPTDKYQQLRGKRFNIARHPDLAHILASPHTILMYPGEGAVGLEGLPVVGGEQPPYNIIVLDGTWQQAKSIYHNFTALHGIKQVCLSGRYVSEYTIRTQPTLDALCTAEAVALALATLEQNCLVYSTLMEPLRMLCRHQLEHGAVPHQSKEHLIASGRCAKPIGKRTYKKLRKCGARYLDPPSTQLDKGDVAGRGEGVAGRGEDVTKCGEETELSREEKVEERGGAEEEKAMLKDMSGLKEGEGDAKEQREGNDESREECEGSKEGIKETKLNHCKDIEEKEEERERGGKDRAKEKEEIREDKEEEEKEETNEKERETKRNFSSHVSCEIR